MTMWLNPGGSKYKNPYSEKAKITKENLKYDDVTHSPEYERALLNPIKKQEPINFSPTIPVPTLEKYGPIQPLSVPNNQNFLQRLGSGIKDYASNPRKLASEIGKGLNVGISNMDAAKQNTAVARINAENPFLSKIGNEQLESIKRQQEFTDANPANTVPAIIGKELTQLPLWMAGYGVVGGIGKGIGKLAPSTIPLAQKASAKVPNFIKGGALDAGAYGTTVAPVESFNHGDSFSEFLDRQKNVPAIFLGGAAFRGIGAGASAGKGKVKEILKPTGVPPAPLGPPRPTYSTQRRSGLGPLRNNDAIPLEQGLRLSSTARRPSQSNPLADVQSAYSNPVPQANPISRSVQRGAELGPLKLSETRTPSYRVKQAELNDTFKDLPIGSVDTPMSRRTLQSGIDESMGIGRQTGEYQGLDAFGKPLQTFKENTDTQNTVAEISTQMTKKLNDIVKSLRQMDNQTGFESIRKKVKDMGGIRQANDGIFEERRAIPNWIRNDKTGRPLDEVADTLGMNSDELLVAISDSSRKIRNFAREAQEIANKDPEYLALGNTLEMLKNELPGKRTLQDVIPERKGVPVFRGFATGKGAKDANLVKPKGIMDVVNEIKGVESKPKYSPVNAEYYTESQSVARQYADQDKGILESLIRDHGEKAGNRLFESFYGRKPMESGTVKEFRINPKKVLDLSDVGENPDATQLINKLLKAEGSPVPTYAKGENINAPKWKRFNEIEKEILAGKYNDEGIIPTYRLLRNMSEKDKSATFFTNWLKKNGYDSVRYAENGTNHYAVLDTAGKTSEFKPLLTKADIKLKPRELTPKSEQLPIQPRRTTLSGRLPVDTPLPNPKPVKKLTPVKKERRTWTNKDGLPIQPATKRPVPEQQTLKDVLTSRGEGPIKAPKPVERGPIKPMESAKKDVREYSVGNEVVLNDGRSGVITRNTSSVTDSTPDYMAMLTVKLGNGKEVKIGRKFVDDISYLNNRQTSAPANAQGPIKPMNPKTTEPKIQKGEATWSNKDVDQPIEVIGYAGKHDGVDYVSVKGSDSAVPLSEIKYNKAAPAGEPKIKPPTIDPINEKLPDAPTRPIAEKVLSKLDDYEAEVRARIQSNKGRLNAGLPVDTLIDYSIIGGIKIARGTVKYSVWAADMVADFGNSIKPHLKDIWEESNKQHSLMVDGTFNNSLPKPQSEIVIGKPKERMGFKEALTKFYDRTVNNQQAIVDGAKITGSDMGRLASNTKNVSGIVDYNFLEGMVNKSGDEVGVSLKSTIDAIPKGKEKEFWTYMSQRHNIDRARVESHQVPKVDKQGFLAKDKDGNQLFNTVVTKKATPVQANYTPNMSKEAVKIAEQANPEYKAVGDNIVKWLDDFMEIWGVDSGIVNKEVYQGLKQTYKSYFPTQRDFSTLEKAIPDNVSQKFADQRTPIRRATGSEKDIIDPVENIMKLVDRTIRTAKYNEVGQSLLNSVRQTPVKLKSLAEVIKTKDGMFSNKDNIITILEDGKPVYLQINDKRFLDAMNGLPKSIGEIPVLSTLTNGFKQLITQSNPIFAVRNIFRDIPTAYVYGSETNPLKFGAGIIGAGKDILTNSSRLKKYRAMGGGGANFFSAGDITRTAGELTGKTNPIKKIASAPIKAIQKFNNMTETAPRLAEFNRVLARTGDVDKALFAANDVTVNFSRSGNITKNVDRFVPYMNAGAQGLDKFFRGFKDPKTAIQTIVKSGVAITTPTLALHLVNKDNPNYQALDNRTKDTYYLIPKEDGTFTRLPKSRELGVLFSSLLERGLRLNAGQDNSFKGFGNTVATNFSPANPIDSNFFNPALEIIGKGDNKDFANRAIVPQSMLMDKRPKYLQYDEKTTSIAKAIGEYSKDFVPGGISPKQLDYFVKSYSGVLGQFGIPLATPGGNSPSKVLGMQFTADPTFSNQATTDFYDKLDKLSAKAVERNIREDIPSKNLTPEEDMRNSMNGVSSALSRGTKLINTIQASDDPKKEEKIKAIKTQMLELTRKSVLADTPKLMQRVEDESKRYFKK